MVTPRINIDLDKIEHNAKELKNLYESKGISITVVTKVVCGDPRIASVLLKSGINTFGDSRVANIMRMRRAGINASFVLIRTPMLSQVMSVVREVEISLNSEITVIRKLSEAALKRDVTHKIILMVELGDLREGLMPSDLEKTVELIMKLKGIDLVGLGTNLACLGGISPDDDNMHYLSALARRIEDKFSLTLTFVSGGNSANYNWFMNTGNVGRINHLRVGESIYLGCEPLNRTPIPGLFTDAFTLVAEVIELKTKPSIPFGDICQDSFGNKLELQNKGFVKRAILGIGKQDVDISKIKPRIDVDIIGASSNHLVLDIKKSALRVGSEVEFDVNYSALLRLMTSPYVEKKYF